MQIGERVKYIRTLYHLTLAEFGDKFGLSRSTISAIENGQRELTRQNMISICREFNVNEEWLRDGVGQMERKAFDLRELLERNHATQLEIDLVQAYFELDTATRETVMDALKQMFASMRGEETPEQRAQRAASDVYKQVLAEEKKVGDLSSASPPTAAKEA